LSRQMERGLTQIPMTGEVTQAKTIGGFSWWQVLFIASIGVLITVCEWVFAYRNVAYGIAIALGLVILIYTILSTVKLERKLVNCAESLALIPLYILFTSSLPWFFINQQYLLPAVYSCILGLVFLHIYQKRLSLKKIFGFSKQKLPKYALIGMAIGLPLGTVEYLILQPAAVFPTFEVKYMLRDLAYMLLFVGLGEEVLFRGIIQQDLEAAFGWEWGLIGASLMFAIMHLTWRSVPELGFVFLAGMVLGYLYWKTKSLTAPIIAHGVNNVMLVAVLPYVLGFS
jgi:membrane protease YdiL (CAAX protease family)